MMSANNTTALNLVLATVFSFAEDIGEYRLR